jgi:FlaG/FlaF family flagellin (archaellin)
MGRPASEDGRRALAPVVATVLMVGITVIIASVGTVLFLGFADTYTQEPAPQASFSYLQNGNAVTITHEVGKPIPAGKLTVTHGEASDPWTAVGTGDPVAAGDSAQVTVSGKTTVAVRWLSPDGSRSATLAERTIDAPVRPTFTGTNAALKTNGDGGNQYIGFGNKRLENAGYTTEGHVRFVSSTNEVQVRDTKDQALTTTGFTPTEGTAQRFTLTYDGSKFRFSVEGATVETTAFSVEEDALAIQVKNRDSNIDQAQVSNLEIDGASIGSPDGFSVTTDQGARSLLLEGGGFDDGFTLTGEFTLETTGPISTDSFAVRIDMA